MTGSDFSERSSVMVCGTRADSENLRGIPAGLVPSSGDARYSTEPLVDGIRATVDWASRRRW